jgi:hypothetical protein
MFENSVYATVEKIATTENINRPYVCRLLRLRLFTPEIVDAILDGRRPSAMTLAVLMRQGAVGWGGQGLGP